MLVVDERGFFWGNWVIVVEGWVVGFLGLNLRFFVGFLSINRLYRIIMFLRRDISER